MSEMTEGAGGERAARVLGEITAIRSRAGAAAHGYWLPLLLFGVLICGSLAFYERLQVPQPALLLHSGSGPCQPGAGSCVTGPGPVITVVTGLGWYWQLAIPVAVVLAVLWYRWRGGRTGLRTPSTPFLVTGLVLGEAVLGVPLLARAGSRQLAVLVHDSHQSGPLIIIAVLLWVLARAERSRALAVLTTGYLVVAIAASAFDNGGLAGGTTGAADVALGQLRLIGLLPALVLLAGGGAAWLVQRRRLRA
jgi:hypothetical protein